LSYRGKTFPAGASQQRPSLRLCRTRAATWAIEEFRWIEIPRCPKPHEPLFVKLTLGHYPRSGDLVKRLFSPLATKNRPPTGWVPDSVVYFRIRRA